MSRWNLPSRAEYLNWKLPMVEIFETVEGEGMMAGFPTVFVRIFHCNLRCTWCDTPYSYAPAKPEFEATIAEIIGKIQTFPSKNICFTGGEPLIHREKSAALLIEMANLAHINDIHIETNGAIDLAPFAAVRNEEKNVQQKARFVMDYKLPDSNEMAKMIHENFHVLEEQDEIKFVIGSDEDFNIARDLIQNDIQKGQVLFSPVWETMKPSKLVEKVLNEPLPNVKVSMQLHKVIWDPNKRGV
ncbi:7-carboxy-7-deazaguanine synthase QueE [Bacillus taeanensis]|uniref:7-carboxy-7-deazaguanine synthase n=1 Tax=Bacillus taeanensis TaxID=273032 RepID=A0A366XYD9_9BACI|nr:radical SAM protein [Bacillus taeanensis]RBW71430.1 radical SAM protein [Bacillus taeanensis]